MGIGTISGIGGTQGSANVGQSGGATSSTTPAATPGGDLGENAFLQLLVAQLQYQDPMQPMDNTQFVTQLAQFQMLSVLNDIKADLDQMVPQTSAGASGSSAVGSGTEGAGASGTGAASGQGS